MSETLELLYESVARGDADLARQTAERALQEKTDPVEAIESGLVRGIKVVGEKFATGEYFLVDLVAGADAFKQALSVLEPELHKKKTKMRIMGNVVLGTVAGDIHSIGKDIVAALFSAAGFRVHDIGVDAPVPKFIEATAEIDPVILGASALMSTTIPEQEKIVRALKEAHLREKVKFIIGGAAVSERWANEIGADGWALTATEGVQRSVELIGTENRLASNSHS